MSKANKNRSFIGKGSIYVREKGAAVGMLPFGNCSELNIAIAEEKQEQKDYENAGGGVTDTVSRISGMTASVTALSLSPANIALALRGLVNVHTSESITEEAAKAYPGGFVAFAKIVDKSGAITVTGTGGTPTYVKDTDYVIKNNGVIFLETGAISAETDVELNYTTLASYDIEGLADSSKEYEFYFDGLNEADSGKSVAVSCYRIKFNPTQALSLISDDYGTLPLSMDILKDDSVQGTGESQYFKMQVAE